MITFASMLEIIVRTLPLIVCVLWAIILMTDWHKQRIVAKLKLSAFMAVSATLYFGHGVFFNGLYELMPLADTLYCTANLAVFPVFYLYIKDVTEVQKHPLRQLLYLLPAIVIGCVVGALYVMMSTEETTAFIATYLYGSSVKGLHGVALASAYVHVAARVIFALQIPPILFFGYKRINAYDREVERNFADVDDKKMYMAKSLLAFFVVASIVSFIANLIGRERFVGSAWAVIVPSLTFSTLLFLLGYAGHRLNFSVEKVMMEVENSPLEGQEIAEENLDFIDNLHKKLELLVEEGRIYLQPDLRVSDVARQLGTNREYVYQAINVRMGISFSDYINSKRVEYAKKLLRENPDMSSDELFARSGFNSSASFYRNFKQLTGMSPRQFVNSLATV